MHNSTHMSLAETSAPAHIFDELSTPYSLTESLGSGGVTPWHVDQQYWPMATGNTMASAKNPVLYSTR